LHRQPLECNRQAAKDRKHTETATDIKYTEIEIYKEHDTKTEKDVIISLRSTLIFLREIFLFFVCRQG
jgi:hypothetical protein